jgi:uncharacterized repeat protein (TIGR02543 family)
VKNIVICLLLAAVAVSAQNKQRVAVLPSVGDLNPQGLILLTDKVREIATKNLPMEDFNVLKQDVITKMIGEEELYRSCKEGVCIGDLAKKTNANYGARCDVIMFENRLVLKFELYSVNEEAIFETFTDYGVKNFDGMLASLEARLPATFKKMVSVSEKAQADAKNKAAEQQRQETAPKPEPPKTHTVATAANPPDGGTVSRSPNYTAYYAGTQVTIVAVPRTGYTFAGWSGGPASASNNIITVTVENNLTLTANFQRIPPPPPPPTVAATPPRETAPSPYAAQQPKPHKTSPAVITLRVASAAVGGISLIGGFVTDGAVRDALDKYSNYGSKGKPNGDTDAENFAKVEKMREDIDNNISVRNTLYVLAGVGLAGFAVTLFF